MDCKRILLLSGHYGSGKTNIAVNMAFDLKKQHNNVAIADLDIVNPYFRTKDSNDELNEAGIRLICSEYANTNVSQSRLLWILAVMTVARMLLEDTPPVF